MGGMKVSELEFVRLLPAFMRDDEAAIALSKAMNRLIGEPSKRMKTLRVWDNIDSLNEAECDEMAWELDVDWYDSTGMSLDEKRTTLKIAQQIKRKRGTKWAVEQTVIAAFGKGEVLEWFDYGGTPFFFRIRTNATLTESGIGYFIKMIDKVKNVRSHLESIELFREMFADTYVCSYVCQKVKKQTIIDNFNDTALIGQGLNLAAGVKSTTKNIIRGGEDNGEF